MIGRQPLTSASRNNLQSSKTVKLGATANGLGKYENLGSLPSSGLNTGGSTPKTAQGINSAMRIKQQKLENKFDNVTIETQKKVLIQLIQKQQNFVKEIGGVSASVPNDATAQLAADASGYSKNANASRLERVAHPMTPVAITINSGQDGKAQQKLRVLNLNQKQLIQNRIKKSRNRVLPSQQQPESNTYGPQIYNSKEEEASGVGKRGAESFKAAAASQKQLPSTQAARGALTLAQAISSNSAEDRHPPSYQQTQKDGGALKSYIMNNNDQAQNPKQLPLNPAQQQILSQQVL